MKLDERDDCTVILNSLFRNRFVYGMRIFRRHVNGLLRKNLQLTRYLIYVWAPSVIYDFVDFNQL